MTAAEYAIGPLAAREEGERGRKKERERVREQFARLRRANGTLGVRAYARQSGLGKAAFRGPRTCTSWRGSFSGEIFSKQGWSSCWTGAERSLTGRSGINVVGYTTARPERGPQGGRPLERHRDPTRFGFFVLPWNPFVLNV